MGRTDTNVPQHFGQTDISFLSQGLDALDPPKPITVVENYSVAEVVDLLREAHVGCVLVTDQVGKLSGVFTERDVLTKFARTNENWDEIPVSDLMTQNPVSESISSTIAAALYKMSKGGFRHIPIVDEKQIPIGIISVKDILDFLAMQLMRSMFQGK